MKAATSYGDGDKLWRGRQAVKTAASSGGGTVAASSRVNRMEVFYRVVISQLCYHKPMLLL